MAIFRKVDDDLYLITNFKVMYTSLKNQKNLIEVNPSKRLLLQVLVGWISPKTKFYLIVRNPFDRVRSFYKSKFLRAEQNRLSMLKRNKGNWQASTEYFFPYLGLDTKMDPTFISARLASTKIDDMISILPEVYMDDGHMSPQCIAGRTNWGLGFNVRLPIRFERIFKIENAVDLNEMSDTFGLDLSIKLNDTGDLDDQQPLSTESVKTIRRLYKEDFTSFEYDQSPVV